MSLRLTYRETIRAALDTRTPIIGYLRSGAPVYVVCGADDTPPAGDTDPPPVNDDDSSDDDNSSDDDDADADTDNPDVSKLTARMKAADRRASELQKRLDLLTADEKKRKDAELDELTRTKNQLEEAKAETAQVKEDINRLRMQNAFLSVNTVTWHDPEDALGKIDLSEIEVDDKGKVDGKALKAAIAKLAKDRPYLVKQDNGSSTEASGSALNGKRKGEDGKPTREDLASRFPAINR